MPMVLPVILSSIRGNIASSIEDVLICSYEHRSVLVRAGSSVAARLIALTVFPIFLSLELLFEQMPLLMLRCGAQIFNRQAQKREDLSEKLKSQADKVLQCALGILATPLSIRVADAVTGFFLKKREPSQQIRPFGVEEIFGQKVGLIHYPLDEGKVQDLVQNAIKEGKRVSVIGAGFSQGTQTIPQGDKNCFIHTKNLNKIVFSEDKSVVTVGAGAKWEDIQVAANLHGKTVKVKQASDPFSVGGSIAINCHGWWHSEGPISRTIRSLTVVTAQGELKVLRRDDPKDKEEFGLYFGTLGYFGVVVSAEIELADNEYVIERVATLKPEQVVDFYERELKDNPSRKVAGGRLSLDSVSDDPLGEVRFQYYERDTVAMREHENRSPQAPIRAENFVKESSRGSRIERIMLHFLNHTIKPLAHLAIQTFWRRERQRMEMEKKMTLIEALHPPINAICTLHDSKLHAQWLQEYFISGKNLANFIHFLGAELKANNVLTINATIRPVPKDEISVLPYAKENCYAVVICFDQLKVQSEMAKTRRIIERVNQYITNNGDVFYQAYHPWATRQQFETCYGKESVERLRAMKQQYDPHHVFVNAHTARYYDEE